MVFTFPSYSGYLCTKECNKGETNQKQQLSDYTCDKSCELISPKVKNQLAIDRVQTQLKVLTNQLDSYNMIFFLETAKLKILPCNSVFEHITKYLACQ